MKESEQERDSEEDGGIESEGESEHARVCKF